MALPFTAILQAATAFFQWRAEEARVKAVAATYELSLRIEDDIESDENEITRLRTLRTTDSHDAAERLRNRILRAQGIAADLSGAGVVPGAGSAGADQGGDLHPPGA